MESKYRIHGVFRDGDTVATRVGRTVLMNPEFGKCCKVVDCFAPPRSLGPFDTRLTTDSRQGSMMGCQDGESALTWTGSDQSYPDLIWWTSIEGSDCVHCIL